MLKTSVRILILLVAALPAGFGLSGLHDGRPTPAAGELPPGATRCDISVPIRIELIPANLPEVGGSARFLVATESALDRDIVNGSWVEYSVRRRAVRTAIPTGRRQLAEAAGRGRTEFDVPIVDETPHEVRARYVVRLIDGRTIAQTAVRWVDLGDPDQPEGMIGRVQNPDGTGIRIYRGRTER